MPGGKRDVLRGADFNSSVSLDGFFVDSGSWTVTGGALAVAAQSIGKDAASVFYVDDYLPVYYEIAAAVQSKKPTGGWKANAYIVFDYFSPTDFKFTGIDISTNKLVMGYRDASGWNVIAQTPKMMKGDTFYNLLVTVNGTTATLIVDGAAGLQLHLRPTGDRRAEGTPSTRAWSGWAPTTPTASSTTSGCRCCRRR